MKRQLILLLIPLMLCGSLVADSQSVPVMAASPKMGQGKISHVMLILLENEAYESIIGNTAEAPYQNQIASRYALAANYFSIEHPSLPNYLDLTAGADMGLSNTDCSPSPTCQVTGVNTNIADLLDSQGLSWKEYAESMPVPCDMSDSGPEYPTTVGIYAVRHNPFAYYAEITGNRSYCNSHVVPFEDANVGFYADLNGSRLPDYSFITPNTCHDGHDACPGVKSTINAADTWLSHTLPSIINSAEFSSTALFIVYDEGTTSPASQVFAIVVSPFARVGFASHIHYTHFSVLATTERFLGLGSLGRNDTVANVMSDMFTTSISTSVSATCSPPFVIVGVPITCTATVNGSAPSGSMIWLTSGNGLFSNVACTLYYGYCSVTYTASSLSTPVVIKAAYLGDVNNAASSGSLRLTRILC